MKTPLEFSRLRTQRGEPVATVISDFRTKMDGYDLADPPPFHADTRRLILIGQEFAKSLVPLECAADLMTHDWEGRGKYRLPGVARVAGADYAVILCTRMLESKDVLEVQLAELIDADKWAPNRFMTPEKRYDPDNIKALGANYYAVGPVHFPKAKQPRPFALGYTTRCVVLEDISGLELGDVWPVNLPDRAAREGE